MARTVNVHAAKTRLSRLLVEVGAGDEVVIARAGKPVARLAIKVQLGKLKLPDRLERFIPSRLGRYSVEVLPIQLSHALRAGSLPPLHRDPFNRMLVSQSRIDGLPILTADPLIAQYDVEVIW